MRNAFTKSCLLALIVALAVATPALAQSSRTVAIASTTHALPSDAEVQSIVNTANDMSLRLPSRARVGAIADANTRLFLTKVLDQVEAAQGANRMTSKEMDAFAADIQATVASAQVGITACATPVDVAVELDATVSGGRAVSGERDATVEVAQAAAKCSCVQNCYNEWQANLRTCNGGYWCQVGFNLLFELCLADCLVPG